jgi:hypothetical protein
VVDGHVEVALRCCSLLVVAHPNFKKRISRKKEDYKSKNIKIQDASEATALLR